MFAHPRRHPARVERFACRGSVRGTCAAGPRTPITCVRIEKTNSHLAPDVFGGYTRSMKYIVTGGAGLIGSNIARQLNESGETDLLIVDHLNGNPLKQRNLDSIQYAAYMERDAFRAAVHSGKIEPPKAFFHLGACSSTTETNEAFLEDNNTAYTREMCEWCLQNESRFVYASSAATYGDGAQGYSDDEAGIPSLQPLNLYGWSKQRFDLWLLKEKLFNRVAGLKYFNVFGPGEDHKGDMRSVVNKSYGIVRDKGRMTLFRSDRPDYADGCQDRDFVYVKDAAAVTVWLGEHPEVNGIFNCGTGHARTWLDLANALFKAVGKEPVIDFIDMPEKLRGKYQYHTEAEMAKLYATGCPVQFRPLEDAVLDYVRTHLSRFAD